MAEKEKHPGGVLDAATQPNSTQGVFQAVMEVT